jgi:hypothetical protein
VIDTPPLFAIPADLGEPQRCDRCPAAVTASIDGIRARGWVAYDGTSFTGAPLNVRLCPACRRGNRGDHDPTDRLEPVPQVQPGLFR